MPRLPDCPARPPGRAGDQDEAVDDRPAEAEGLHGGLPAVLRAQHGLRPLRHVLRPLHDALLDLLLRGSSREGGRQGLSADQTGLTGFGRFLLCFVLRRDDEKLAVSV